MSKSSFRPLFSLPVPDPTPFPLPSILPSPHSETNRKCPKWAEFNLAPQTQAPSATGLPLIGSQFDQSLCVLHFLRLPFFCLADTNSSFGAPSFSSDQDMDAPGKIKLSLQRADDGNGGGAGSSGWSGDQPLPPPPPPAF